MAGYDPLDPDNDVFRPPAIPTLVACLHCGEEYESYRIEWRVERDADGKQRGFWCCPIEGCGGCGFGFDILPVDPNYRDEHGGWVSFDDDEEEDGEEFDSEEDGAWPEAPDEGAGPPAPPGDEDDPLPW
jgi:hypothetical protein